MFRCMVHLSNYSKDDGECEECVNTRNGDERRKRNAQEVAKQQEEQIAADRWRTEGREQKTAKRTKTINPHTRAHTKTKNFGMRV